MKIETMVDVRGIDLDMRTVTLKIGGDPYVARAALRQLVKTLEKDTQLAMTIEVSNNPQKKPSDPG